MIYRLSTSNPWSPRVWFSSLIKAFLDFDVYMNLTLDDAEDVSDGKTQKLGKILLRGDNVLTISLPDDDS